MGIKYFWINLDTAKERRENLLKQFQDNNITNHKRVVAYPSINNDKRMKENACCRSHLNAVYQFLMDTNDEYALICEDDLSFELKKFWRSSVEEVIKNAPSDWGIIQLATIIQGIDVKFKERPLYFKWSDQPSSSCLAWVINRKCAVKLLNEYFSGYILKNSLYKLQTPDSFSDGVYARIHNKTDFQVYTYKYPMFIYPDTNDSQLDNCLDLHNYCKRQLISYLIKYQDKKE